MPHYSYFLHMGILEKFAVTLLLPIIILGTTQHLMQEWYYFVIGIGAFAVWVATIILWLYLSESRDYSTTHVSRKNWLPGDG